MEVDLTIQHKHTIKTETTKTKKAVLSTSLLRRCKEAITTGKKRKEVLFSKAFNASTPLGSQIILARKIKNKQTGKIHSKFVLSCAFLSNQLFWKAPAIAVENRYNSHNTYLQILLNLGILGFIPLLVLLLGALALAWKRKDYLFLMFISTIVLLGITEAIFEGQRGIVFVIFFLFLFIYHSTSESTLDEH